MGTNKNSEKQWRLEGGLFRPCIPVEDKVPPPQTETHHLRINHGGFQYDIYIEAPGNVCVAMKNPEECDPNYEDAVLVNHWGFLSFNKLLAEDAYEVWRET